MIMSTLKNGHQLMLQRPMGTVDDCQPKSETGTTPAEMSTRRDCRTAPKLRMEGGRNRSRKGSGEQERYGQGERRGQGERYG